eukprot:XP_001703833.1 Hypothetical protein GL50803_123979 [Giardia lamblia ATCC 50803]
MEQMDIRGWLTAHSVPSQTVVQDLPRVVPAEMDTTWTLRHVPNVMTTVPHVPGPVRISVHLVKRASI